MVSSLNAPTKDGYEFKKFNLAGSTVIVGDTTVVVIYDKIVNVEASLDSELATVDTDNLLTLDVSDNKINTTFASEDTNMLLLFNPIVDVLEAITNDPAYESVVVSYNGQTLVLSDLDYSKLGLINFMLKDEDATKVARFIAWVAFNSGSGSDIMKVKPSDLIGKSLDVQITLSDGNVSENSLVTEDYDLVFKLAGATPANVTYDANGGTFIDGETVKIVGGYFSGNTIVEPELSEREGYTFNGWYNGTTKFDFSTNVATDITLVANWSANEYTVTWVTANETKNETYEYGTTPAFVGSTNKAADETYTYTFTGWDKEIAPVTGNVTYTAQYSKKFIDYTIEFVVEGEVVSSSTYHYGDVVKVPTDPTKEGNAQYSYEFAGWDSAVTQVTGNKTYTAVFEETVNEYDVSFVIDGETTTNKVTYGSTATQPSLTKDGYTLDGWYTDNGYTTAYDFATTITENVTLYARWNAAYTTGAYTDTNGDVTLNFGAVNGSGNNDDRNRTVTIEEEDGTEIVSVTVTGTGRVTGGILTNTTTETITVTNNSYTVTGDATSPIWGQWGLSKVEGGYTYTITIKYYKYTEDSTGNRVYETDANGENVLYTTEFINIF